MWRAAKYIKQTGALDASSSLASTPYVTEVVAGSPALPANLTSYRNAYLFGIPKDKPAHVLFADIGAHTQNWFFCRLPKVRNTDGCIHTAIGGDGPTAEDYFRVSGKARYFAALSDDLANSFNIYEVKTLEKLHFKGFLGSAVDIVFDEDEKSVAIATMSDIWIYTLDGKSSSKRLPNLSGLEGSRDSPPIVLGLKGSRLLVRKGSDSVMAVDTTTGQVLWVSQPLSISDVRDSRLKASFDQQNACIFTRRRARLLSLNTGTFLTGAFDVTRQTADSPPSKLRPPREIRGAGYSEGHLILLVNGSQVLVRDGPLDEYMFSGNENIVWDVTAFQPTDGVTPLPVFPRAALATVRTTK